VDCTPSALIEAARCFKCIPAGLQSAVHNYLLCQWENHLGANCTLCSFLTYPTTAARNDLNISTGFRFTVKQAITVCRLGRLYIKAPSPNTENHLARLWISTDQVTPIASGTILAASASDANDFKWVDITPVTLNVGSTYAVGLDENQQGDLWKDTWSVLANLNYTYFANVVEGFKTNWGYPSVGAAADKMYGTPALWFEAT
jgi:hypothetical protein